MSTISARVLELLTLLQSRRHWSGEDLASRLEVSPRTLRRDVKSLQDLGYPITTMRGTGGGYQLAPGGSLPPLVLNEDEAIAVVIALKEAAASNQMIESRSAITALAKIVQVLPSKIRRRIDSLQRVAMLPGSYPHRVVVDTAVLTTFALAARDHETLTFEYTDAQGVATNRHVQPHYIVSVYQRLYLVAYDLTRRDWRTFRLDRATNPQCTRQSFMPRALPVDDPAEYVRDSIKNTGMSYEVVAKVETPAAKAQEHLGKWGTVTSIDEHTCEVHIPVGDLDWTIFALATLHAPFTICGPDEAISGVADWGNRLSRAAGMSKV
ncbi:MAG: YafY family protein [Corynebacterium sp.]|nr:YafY family protein [Corynebacterium sp.]